MKNNNGLVIAAAIAALVGAAFLLSPKEPKPPGPSGAEFRDTTFDFVRP